MVWRGRRGSRPDVGESGLAADGLDARSWDALWQSVPAAHRGDAEAHVVPLLRYERDAPADVRAGVYLWFLLRYRVAELLGRRPSPEDLHVLAVRFHPEFARLVLGDQRRLEDTLLTVFALAADGGKVTGGDAVVMGSAALGVLLDDDPEAQLAAMRPALADWWRRNADRFRDLGAR